MLPLPIVLAVGFVVGFIHAARGKPFDESVQLTLTIVEWAVVLFFLTLAAGLYKLFSADTRGRRGLKDDDLDGEYFFQQRQRRRHRDEDDRDRLPRRRPFPPEGEEIIDLDESYLIQPGKEPAKIPPKPKPPPEDEGIQERPPRPE
jgi:hypothetical protein